MYSHLIYLKVKVMCVHLQRKSLLKEGDPQLAEIEDRIKKCQGEERHYEKKASQYQTVLDKLMSEKNKDEG